jgi:hypothetical protein
MSSFSRVAGLVSHGLDRHRADRAQPSQAAIGQLTYVQANDASSAQSLRLTGQRRILDTHA